LVLSASPQREYQSEHVRDHQDDRQGDKKMLLRHGDHPFTAAAIHARPPITPVTPAAMPRLLASVAAVTNTAAVVSPAAIVQMIAARMLYALELTR
jgi:hypothetical protein